MQQKIYLTKVIKIVSDLAFGNIIRCVAPPEIWSGKVGNQLSNFTHSSYPRDTSS